MSGPQVWGGGAWGQPKIPAALLVQGSGQHPHISTLIRPPFIPQGAVSDTLPLPRPRRSPSPLQLGECVWEEGDSLTEVGLGSDRA